LIWINRGKRRWSPRFAIMSRGRFYFILSLVWLLPLAVIALALFVPP
jgi:hypothetical protein